MWGFQQHQPLQVNQRNRTDYCQHSCSTAAYFSFSVPPKTDVKSREQQRAGQMALHPGGPGPCSRNAWCGNSGKPLMPVLPATAISRELSSAPQLQLVPVACCVCPLQGFIHAAASCLPLHSISTWKVIQATLLLQPPPCAGNILDHFPAVFVKLSILFLCTHATVSHF